jgi:hypothetical protein
MLCCLTYFVAWQTEVQRASRHNAQVQKDQFEPSSDLFQSLCFSHHITLSHKELDWLLEFGVLLVTENVNRELHSL